MFERKVVGVAKQSLKIKAKVVVDMTAGLDAQLQGCVIDQLF